MALSIFAARYPKSLVTLHSLSDHLPKGHGLYSAPQNCWFAVYSFNQSNLIASSRVVCFSKDTGEIMREGSLNDEG